MSSPITVGLLGHNGLVGSHVLRELIPLHQNGTFKLSILHRPDSSLTDVPEDVDRRVIDLTEPDGPAYDEAVKGLQIIVSTVGVGGIKSQTKFIPALSRSKGFVTFLPSEYGAPWSEEEAKTTNFPAIQEKDQVIDEFKKAGVPYTVVQTGLFSSIGFKFPLLWDVKGNKINVYRNSQDTGVPFNTDPHTARSIVEIIKKPANAIANKTLYTVEFKATGAEIAAVLAKIHGKEPELVEIEDEKLKGLLTNPNPFLALGGAILRKSGELGYGFDGEEIKVPGWKSEDLETIVRRIHSA